MAAAELLGPVEKARKLIQEITTDDAATEREERCVTVLLELILRGR